ncbi:MAG: hypothetical protein H0T71_03355 [Acidobacteria bacterium]|nr:hypothetical protein [Acidobacteriota bacterium]
MTVELDIWVRGTPDARTHRVELAPASAGEWRESDVHRLMSEMLLALNRETNPDAEPPPVAMRGFSWIVSPYESGVVVHVEMQIGTVSAGPLAIDEARLTALISRVMKNDEPAASVH